MIIGALGPEGTFSELAARKALAGRKGKIMLFPTIPAAFDALEKRSVGLLVVPLENSLEGTERATIRGLMKHDFSAGGEVIVDIHHSLATAPGTKKINRILSHPQALSQTEEYRQKKFPGAEAIHAASTAAALRELLEGKHPPNTAAIGREDVAKRLGLRIVAKNIEDETGNQTRFLIVGRKDNPNARSPKTSIILHQAPDEPGLLHDLLGPFKRGNINLTKIESMPTKKKLGDYYFYLDFDGSRKDAAVKRILGELKKRVAVKVLGTYQKRS